MPRKSANAFGFPTEASQERLHPPSELGGVERQIFTDIVATNRPEHFRSSDLPLLSAYARAIVLERRFAEQLADGDAKALPMWNGAVKAIVALSMRLRLSPQARQPNNSARSGRAEQPTSFYDRQQLLEGETDE